MDNRAPIGFQSTVVPGDQPRVPIRFDASPEESDPGPYPIPLDAPSREVPTPRSATTATLIVIDRDAWTLYELFAAFPDRNGWRAGSGAIFDLATNTNRPFEWTSADAGGLLIFPGLARYDEVVGAGVVRHALRFTCKKVRRAYVAPPGIGSTTTRTPTSRPWGCGSGSNGHSTPAASPRRSAWSWNA